MSPDRFRAISFYGFAALAALGTFLGLWINSPFCLAVAVFSALCAVRFNRQ